MILGKTLLLKGLAGVTALAGSTIIGFGIKNNWWQKSDPESIPTSVPQLQASLMERAGLTCDSSSRICSLKGNKTIIFKQNSNTSDEISTITSTNGKIKLKEGSVNNQENPEFIVSEGDITLTNTNGGTVTKLEQFETYEIEEVDEAGTKKYYLKRKHTATQEKEIILGLPAGCNLPENGATCTSVPLDSEKLNNLNFEGKTSSSQASIYSGATVTLSITKESEDTDIFTDGYKFSFQATGGNATITTNETITIPANKSVEFRIKKENQNLSLEKAWTLQTLTAKVGLSCDTDNSCTQKTPGTSITTNIKQDNDTQTLTTSWTSGKIKVYTTEATNYNKGFRFVIEEGDITFNTDKKLEEGDTYEIKKEDDNKWYFFRKTESESKKIRKALGLPEGCKLPKEENNPITCENIDVEKLKKLNFEGKNDGGTWTIGDGSQLNLKITKTSDTTTFPKGYRFAFEGDKEISIPLSGSTSITLKKNTNIEFKIKVSDSGNFSLEKAWTISTLSAKVNLSGCTASADSKKECTFGEKINLFKDNQNSVVDAKVTEQSRNKKIKYEEDQEGYNQGFKFCIDENILLEGGIGNTTPTLAMMDANSSSGGQKPTYEIKEQTVGGVTNWYLSKYTAPAI